MAIENLGRMNWDLTRDDQGHRTYSIDWKIKAENKDQGPQNVIAATSAYPSVGSTWAFGTDSDPWAFCLPECRLRPMLGDEANLFWILSQTFTTKPMKRCNTATIENPLLEPYTIGGTFRKYSKNATKDRFGSPLVYSNHEPITGDAVMIETSKPTVEIGFNVATLPLSTLCVSVDCLNDSTLWGLPKRTIKFTDVSWSRKIYGVCFYYWTVNYSFEISLEGWDKDILDRGRLVLKTGGDKDNPKDFEVYKDAKDENSFVLLDGAGKPLTDINSPYYHHKELLQENNLLLLGIPTSI